MNNPAECSLSIKAHRGNYTSLPANFTENNKLSPVWFNRTWSRSATLAYKKKKENTKILNNYQTNSQTS